MRFLSAAFGEGIVGVQASADGFIVFAAELSGNGPVEASITVGPDGTCPCKISAGGAHLASTASDARAFEQVLSGWRRSACSEGVAPGGVDACSRYAG